MTDAELERHLAAARRADVAWTPSREQQASWGASQRFEARRRRRKRLLAVSGALGTSVAAAVVALLVWPAPKPSTSARAPASLTSTLADGLTILLDDAATVVRKTVEREGEIGFQLESGGAGFDVAHRPSREFRVQAGPVSVKVIGTRFYVRRAGLQSRVAVDRGRVLVSWAGGSTTLGAGETGLYPPPPADDAPAAKEAAPLPEPATAPARRSSAPEPKQQRPDELFLRADRMRAASNPAGAVASLGELVRRFPTDPRAGAAAFTMGRLLLERLDRPQQAAAAFATARRLSAVRSLEEDALAREVEALAKAGDRDQARQRAELYARLFPEGARRATVMRLAGLPAAR